MKSVSAREAKYNFGKLIDTARAEPVVIEKHGRPVVVVVAVEEFERLTGQLMPERSQDKGEKRTDASLEVITQESGSRQGFGKPRGGCTI